MLSLLTMEERIILKTIGCRNRQEAIEMLSELEKVEVVSNEMLKSISALKNKLEKEYVDLLLILNDG